MQQVVRTQQSAGVEVLHHDIQTVPDHLSATALAKSGSPGAQGLLRARRTTGKRGGHKSGGYKGSNPKAGYRSGGGYQGGQKSEGGPRKTGAPSYGKGKTYAGKRATAAR